MLKLDSIFTKAIEEIFNETGIKIYNIKDCKLPVSKDERVITSIGITGKIKGSFMLITDKKTAKAISAKMLDNMQLNIVTSNFGPLNQAALGEITNQISGRAMTILSEKNINCDITPPTMVIGNNIKIITTDNENYKSRYIKSNLGVLHFVIGLKN